VMKGSDSPSSRKQVEDRFVVEIKIVSCPGQIYTTNCGKYETFCLIQ